MKKNLYILLLFQTLVISAFGINVTTTAPNTGVSKVMTVENGKVYELNFNIDLLSTSLVEVNIKDQGLNIASQQISTSGSKALAFTLTSNAITIEFNRMDIGTAYLQFEVDNIQLKEVVNSKLTHEVGIKNYELSDHLGNVRTTVSDKKVSGSSKVISANDYYPFGMEARSVSNSEYRYGFNGKESDQSFGTGNRTQDYGFRMYNAGIAKFLSIDPLAADYPWYTPYQFAGNKPIWAIDLDGLEEFFRTDYFNAAGQLYKTEIKMVSTYGSERNEQTVHHTEVRTTLNRDLNPVFTKTYTGTTQGTTRGASSTGDNAFSSPRGISLALDNSIRQKALKIDATGAPLRYNLNRPITVTNALTPPGGSLAVSAELTPVSGAPRYNVGFIREVFDVNGNSLGVNLPGQGPGTGGVNGSGQNVGPLYGDVENVFDAASNPLQFSNIIPAGDPSKVNAIPINSNERQYVKANNTGSTPSATIGDTSDRVLGSKLTSSCGGAKGGSGSVVKQ